MDRPFFISTLISLSFHEFHGFHGFHLTCRWWNEWNESHGILAARVNVVATKQTESPYLAPPDLVRLNNS